MSSRAISSLGVLRSVIGLAHHARHRRAPRNLTGALRAALTVRADGGDLHPQDAEVIARRVPERRERRSVAQLGRLERFHETTPRRIAAGRLERLRQRVGLRHAVQNIAIPRQG